MGTAYQPIEQLYGNEIAIERRIHKILDVFDFQAINAIRRYEPGGVTKLATSWYFEYSFRGEDVILNDQKIQHLSEMAGPLVEVVFPGFELEKSLKFSEPNRKLFDQFFLKHGTRPWTT